tara:strand:- start:42592 stop:43299 length:708 start_codon:yes stop_codon:yes gene_type:complete
MKIKFIVLAFLSVSVSLFSQVEKFNALLKNNITNKGVVNYKGILENKTDLTNYIDYLSQTTPKKSWSDEKKKAFWINAYNAYTILIIIDNYPLSSILKINSKGKDAWHQDIAIVGGEKYTLNAIEHEILRKEFSDPRIHVGVNCASYSCPPILNKAFTEENVEVELERLMKNFINDSTRNLITSKKVTLSKIFDWYKADFIKNESLVSYIDNFTNVSLTKKTKVRYMEYNWNLNE